MKSHFIIFTFFFILISLINQGHSSNIYVDTSATGSNSGETWTNAYLHLDSALLHATTCDTIRVAQGIFTPNYYPTTSDTSLTNRDKSFFIPSAVTILGGYPNGGGMRDIQINRTVLSGDIGIKNEISDNCYHVIVSISGGTSCMGQIDGFTIEGGNANNVSFLNIQNYEIYRNVGGGIYLDNDSTMISNNVFSSNNAQEGGAVMIINGITEINSNTFLNNKANNNGGAMAIVLGDITITNSVFYNNQSTNQGGGIYIDDGNVAIVNNTFVSNQASQSGGAIYSYFGTCNVGNTIFWKNFAQGQSSDIENGFSTLEVSYCFLQENSQYINNTGCIYEIDPLFIDAVDVDGIDNLHQTNDDGLRLRFNSPAANSGNNSLLSIGLATDILGDDRILNDTVNMGAYEMLVFPNSIFVDSTASGLNLGLSWTDAFVDLDMALQNFIFGDTIFVAQGSYFPSSFPPSSTLGLSERDKTFYIPDGVIILGGYPSGGGVRDHVANPTILSGDLGIKELSTDNCYHVAIITNDVVFDGFHLVDGNAKGVGFVTIGGHAIERNHGGGLHIISGKGKLVNNQFYRNTAERMGGGLFMLNADFELLDNAFRINSADFGGAIYSERSLNVVVRNSITNNLAKIVGGGLYISDGTCKIDFNTIQNNTCTLDGGGVYALKTNCSLLGNTIINNSSGSGGGGLFIDRCQSSIYSCVLAENSSQNGGGIFLTQGNNKLFNNTIYDNNSTLGAGIYYSTTGTTTVANCIFWSNKIGGQSDIINADIYSGNPNPTSLDIKYCLLQKNSNYANNLWCTSGIDPLFKDPDNIAGPDNIHRTEDDGLRLQFGSSGFNTGLNDIPFNALRSDISNRVRLSQQVVDLGAYEDACISPYNTIYVDSSVLVSGLGSSWQDAFGSFAQALDISTRCVGVDTIKVAKGLYTPEISPYRNQVLASDREQTFLLNGMSAVLGGYPSGGGQRDVFNNPTVLSGDIGIKNDSMDNCYHVIVVVPKDSTSTGLLDGFTIKKGNANLNGIGSIQNNRISHNKGGGIYLGKGKIKVSSNIIENNTAEMGAGLYIMENESIIANNRILNNFAYEIGGGVFSDHSSASYFENTLLNNAALQGGAIYHDVCQDSLSQNIVQNNMADQGGGIFSNESSNQYLTNSIQSNEAMSGGGVYSLGSKNVFLNNTIASNIVTDAGGGLCLLMSSDTILENIIKSNNADNGGGIFSSGPSHISHNSITKNFAADHGGGLVINSGNLTFNLVDSNSAKYGGGFSSFGPDKFLCKNNRFISNSASWDGGAALIERGSARVVENEFQYNTTQFNGGAISMVRSTDTLYKNVFAYNSAMSGGAISAVTCNSVIGGNLLVRNAADYSLGGIFCLSTGDPASAVIYNNTFLENDTTALFINHAGEIVNNIFWNHHGDLMLGSQTLINHNLFDAGSIYADSFGCISGLDPLFVDQSNPAGPDGIFANEDDGLRLLIGSPSIDVGTNSILSNLDSLDITGSIRIANNIVDLGAYEGDHEPSATIDLFDEFSRVRVYPNPTQDDVVIESNELGTEVSCSLYALDGTLISSINPVVPISKLSMRHLQHGIYILSTTNGQNTQSVRILKRK